jgi:hypothetical protein
MINAILIAVNAISLFVLLFHLLKGMDGSLRLVISAASAVFYSSSLLPFSLFIGIPLALLYLISACIILGVIFFLKKDGYEISKPDLTLKEVVFVVLFIFSSYRFFHLGPSWGEWDAWAIWNLKARFLTDDENWRGIFSGQLEYSHLDYPLLLPSIIASVWKIIGNFDVYIPMYVSYGIFIFLIASSFFSLKNIFLSLFFSFLLMFDLVFVNQVSYQYADSILGLSYLLSSIVFIKYLDKPSKRYIIVLGFLSSSSVFIKNEGWIFYLLVMAFVIYRTRNRRNDFIGFLLSSVFFLFLSFAIKYISPSSNDLFQSTFSEMIDRALSLNRLVSIIKHFALESLVNFQPMFLLLIIFFSLKVHKGYEQLLYILSFTLLGYLSIYLITPHDLQWHLSTSAIRLMHQLYPSFLFLFFISIEKRMTNPIVQVL